MKKKQNDEASPLNFEGGIGGIFKGLGDLVERLKELQESGETLSQSGELRGQGKEVKGMYGFTVKVGLGDDKPRVEPFGNIRKDKESGRTVVQEVREPMVDIFEEDAYVLVVAEMPGVTPDDVKLTIDGDVLTIDAVHGAAKYHKEVLLPLNTTLEKIQVSGKNGIVEIKCAR